MLHNSTYGEPTRARPRPKRFSSSNRTAPAQEDHVSYAETDENGAGPSSPRSERPRQSPHESPNSASAQQRKLSGSALAPAALIASPVIESDLGIDLSVDLTRALRRRSSHRRPRQRGSIGDENSSSRSPAGSPDGKRSPAYRRQGASRSVLAELSSPQTPWTNEHVIHSIDSIPSSDADTCPASTSYDSITHDFEEGEGMSELSRSQLEQRLARATAILKERERDLGIAAAVGQALLEKNLTLRKHHADVMAQPLPSLDSLERMVGGHVPLTTPLPRYSPPHSDGALEQAATSPLDDDETPRIQQLGYFPSTRASPGYEATEEARQIRASSSSGSTASTSQLQDGNDTTHSVATLPRSGTRRQLDLICEQNEHLLQQLAQLQSENEQAKRKDGRRLKKLKKEIDGLQSELEAAELRNVQLEEEAVAKARRVSGSRQVKTSSPPTPQRAHKEYSTSSTEDTLSRSSSTHSRRTITEDERVLVEQLLRKVHELEEMNSALTREAGERDERIGRFLVDSERLCDMYDAVESEAASELGSVDLNVEQSPMSRWSPGSIISMASPIFRRKGRGAGNRHYIEGRRTLRSVLRSPEAPSGQSRPTLASPFSQPKPRIFVTPSIEDLREKMLRQQSGEVENVVATELDNEAEHGYRRSWADSPASDCETDNKSGRFPAQVIENRSLGSEIALSDLEHSALYSVATSSDILARPLRKIGSNQSLRSAAESDIADAYAAEQWRTQGDGASLDVGMPPLQHRLAIQGAAESSAMASITNELQLSVDGDYFDGTDDSIVAPGSLRDGQQTSYEDYDRLERLTARATLPWADDEDFGKPITERHARRIGLLDAPKRLRRKVSTSLLAWARPKQKNAKGKSPESSRDSVSMKQLESSDDIELRQEEQVLLRKQRQIAIKWRVANGQLSSEEAKRRGAFNKLAIEPTGQHKACYSDDAAFEAELTRRTFADRRRGKQTSISSHLNSPFAGTRQSSPFRNDKRKGMQAESDALTLVERYHPRAIRRRVHHLSTEAMTWIAAWAAFSVVMVLAFIATFARGPRRVLHGRRV